MNDRTAVAAMIAVMAGSTSLAGGVSHSPHGGQAAGGRDAAELRRSRRGQNRQAQESVIAARLAKAERKRARKNPFSGLPAASPEDATNG